MQFKINGEYLWLAHTDNSGYETRGDKSRAWNGPMTAAIRSAEFIRNAGQDCRIVDAYDSPVNGWDYKVLPPVAIEKIVSHRGCTPRRMPNSRRWIFNFPTGFPYAAIIEEDPQSVLTTLFGNPVYKPFIDSLPSDRVESTAPAVPPTPEVHWEYYHAADCPRGCGCQKCSIVQAHYRKLGKI